MRFKWFVLVLTVVSALNLQAAITTQASCATPQEEGSWVNVDSNTRSITRAEIRFQCQDQILNGQAYPPGFPYYVHLYGSCHPQDCDWGEVGATRVNSWIYTTLDHGFAKYYIWVKAYPSPTQTRLRVYIWTDFRASNRQDFASDDWFVQPQMTLLDTTYDACSRDTVRIWSNGSSINLGRNESAGVVVSYPTIFWFCENSRYSNLERTTCPVGTNYVVATRNNSSRVTWQCYRRV
ncbi:MAG: hypothetical protein KC708_19425 [Anaerolineae bacterium]|nr:hypothetical protein [Anaerolineae bacterium]